MLHGTHPGLFLYLGAFLMKPFFMESKLQVSSQKVSGVYNVCCQTCSAHAEHGTQIQAPNTGQRLSCRAKMLLELQVYCSFHYQRPHRSLLLHLWGMRSCFLHLNHLY